MAMPRPERRLGGSSYSENSVINVFSNKSVDCSAILFRFKPDLRILRAFGPDLSTFLGCINRRTSPCVGPTGIESVSTKFKSSGLTASAIQMV